MRPYIIGIILFLVWSLLSSWYYVTKIYPVGQTDDNQGDAPETEAVISVPEETPPPPPEKPGNITLYFDYNKADVMPSESLLPFIEKSREFLQYDSGSCLSLTGYTCSLGSDQRNMELGMERAESVKAYLEKQGFSGKCMKISSGGETNPVAGNDTEDSRKQNRRVELELIKK